MLRGARLDESFVRRHGVLADFRLGPNTFGNLEIILPDGICVSVPYQEEFVRESPYKIRDVKRRLFLTTPEGGLPVKWISQPDYYGQPVNAKARIGEVACVHGNYVALSLGGHRYLEPTLTAADGTSSRPELVISVDEAVAVLERIRKDRPIDVVSLSCWEPGSDGGIKQVEAYVRAIKKFFNVLVFVEVHLPDRSATIDETYAMGADSVCYHIGNLCSHGGDRASAEREKKAEMRLLRHAVSVFPAGTILAHVTIGENSVEESREDIDALCGAGVLPILTVESLEVAHCKGLSAAEIAPLFGEIYDRAKQNGIKMNWFSKLSPFVTPMEGRFFTGDIPRLKLALMNFYQSRILGGSISSGLSNLRRKLRVKTVSNDEE